MAGYRMFPIIARIVFIIFVLQFYHSYAQSPDTLMKGHHSPQVVGDTDTYADLTTDTSMQYKLVFNDPTSLPANELDAFADCSLIKHYSSAFLRGQFIHRYNPNNEVRIETGIVFETNSHDSTKGVNKLLVDAYKPLLISSVRHIFYFQSKEKKDPWLMDMENFYSSKAERELHDKDHYVGNWVLPRYIVQSGISLGFMTLDYSMGASAYKTKKYRAPDGSYSSLTTMDKYVFPSHIRVISLGYEQRASFGFVALNKDNNSMFQRHDHCEKQLDRWEGGWYVRAMYAPVMRGKSINDNFEVVDRFAGSLNLGFAIGGYLAPGYFKVTAEVGYLPGMGTYLRTSLPFPGLRIAKSQRTMSGRILPKKFEYNKVVY